MSLAIRSIHAGPVGLPDSDRPGAVRPQQDGSEDLSFDRSPDKAGPASEGVEIPAVIDRPFEVDEGDVVIVKGFRLIGGEDLSDAGVDIEAIHQLLEEQRASRPRGLTIGRLQEVADVVTNYCRSQGLILAQAVIPVQTVVDDIIEIQIFPGKLGRVLAEGNERYAARILEKPFRGLTGKPVNKAQIEAALLTLTDYPGLSVFGVFQPGQAVGTADIVLRVQDEKPFDVAFRVDGHGTQETGRNRFRTVFEWNNITGFADRMTFTGQQTFNPANAYFMGVEYERFFAHGFKVGGFIDANAFDVGGAEFADADVSSRSENEGLFIEKSFIRSRQRNFSMRFGLARKRSQSFAQGQSISLDRLSVLTLSADIDSVDTFSLFGEGGGINFSSLVFSQGIENFLGSMGSASEAELVETGFQPNRRTDSAFASGRFSKLYGSFTRLQTLFENHSLLFHSEFQWSSDLLVPIEQYAVGGADNLRAFPSAQILWDSALFTSLEWIMNAPGFASKLAFDNYTWGELLQLSLFYDMAIGSINRSLENQQRGYKVLQGAGIGLNFAVPGFLESRLMFAREIGGETARNDRSLQIWGDFTYRF